MNPPAACRHWIGGETRYCLVTDHVRPYLTGPRCPAHTPAALARRPHATKQGASNMELRPNPEALLRNALVMAERGWHVFPVAVNAKWPALHAQRACPRTGPCAAGHLGWEQRATIDPERIRRCWSAAPYNIGIACGPSALLVVDLDVPKPGQKPPAEYNLCGDGIGVFSGLCHRAGQPYPDATYTVRTGRDGRHLYFTHPTTGPRLRNTAGTLGWLIDTRAHGGYVLAAGSVVDGSPYATALDVDPVPLPGWLTEQLTPTPPPPQRRPVVVDLGTGRRAAYLRKALDAEARHVTEAVEGGRNRALFGAAMALGQLVAGGSLSAEQANAVLEDAAIRAGLGHAETMRTIESGFRRAAGRPRSVAA